jgi:hypothetical protein
MVRARFGETDGKPIPGGKGVESADPAAGDGWARPAPIAQM